MHVVPLCWLLPSVAAVCAKKCVCVRDSPQASPPEVIPLDDLAWKKKLFYNVSSRLLLIVSELTHIVHRCSDEPK
eukprot:14400-Eustigmatos_ZCMA.PRE.1